MDRLDWEFDKGSVLLKLLLYGIFYAMVTVAAGYFFHIGWALYDTPAAHSREAPAR